MALTRFTFTKLWTNPDDFPTYEGDETQVRADMQELHNETQNYINNTLCGEIEDMVDAAVLGQIPDRSLTHVKLERGTITSVELADSAVPTAKLVAGAVTTDKLASNSVTTPKILNGAVTPAKLEHGGAEKVYDQRSGNVFKIWQGTATQYNAIANKDPLTLYFVEEE